MVIAWVVMGMGAAVLVALWWSSYDDDSSCSCWCPACHEDLCAIGTHLGNADEIPGMNATAGDFWTDLGNPAEVYRCAECGTYWAGTSISRTRRCSGPTSTRAED